MRLEFFREHKNIVYYVMLPLVSITMVFYFSGSSGFWSARNHAAPRLTYTVHKTDYPMSSAQVLAERALLTKYSHRGQADTGAVGDHQVEYGMAKLAGFELGAEETKAALRDEVKAQLQQREPSAPPLATEEVYEKLLGVMQMSAPDFERIACQQRVIQKYFGFQLGYPVNDGELFANFCMDKQVVRLRYKTFKSADYMSKVKDPTDDKVKEFYNTNKDKKSEMKDVLYTEPKLAAELIAIDTAKYLATLKPEEKDLKDYYERHKMIEWAVPIPAGTAPPPPEKRYKPYEEVKAEVDKKWRDEKKMMVSSELSTIQKDLEKAEGDYKTEQAKKPEAERKPFDVKDWVAKKNVAYLVYWTTPEQTEEQYKKGKSDFNAPDAKWVEGIFRWSKAPPSYLGGDTQKYVEMFKTRFEAFTFPTPIDSTNMDKGFVIARKLKFTDMELKPLDAAKPAVIEHLKVLDAIDLAQKDAKKAREDWDQGKELPKVEDLDEFKASSENEAKNALAEEYFKSPKPIGEVLPVAQAPAEEPKPDAPPSLHSNFYVGFAVEIQLPTSTGFDKDTVWDRTQHREELSRSFQQSLYQSLYQQIKDSWKKIPRDLEDPPLFDGRNDE